MNKTRNAPVAESMAALAGSPTSGSLGFAPFSARSIVLSVLLGSHPPSLPIGAMVALAELFSIPAGTMRTALSRMVAAGDLVNEQGRYTLAGRLVARQRSQDQGRQRVSPAWDGSWWTVIALSDRRSVAERRAFRAELADLRFGELRPDTWLRPANLGLDDEQRLASIDATIVTRGPMLGPGGESLARRLWPLAASAEHMRRLLDLMASTSSRLAGSEPTMLPEAFAVSAAVVRALRTDPRLPDALTPPYWPATELREAYDHYEAGFQRLLRSFLPPSGQARLSP